jgi:phospholipid/cholesterol/gamma-HCH transport system substrate-binding protein
LKISKEIKAGVIAIAAIGLLVAGVNFLKGNSFFGGDQVYYAYFPNSGGVAVASSVMVNGVVVGKITKIQLTNKPDSLKKVLITFNIQDRSLKIPRQSVIEAGAIDLFNKGLILKLNSDISQGYYEAGATIKGIVSVDITSQVKAYADPLVQKVQTALGSIDKMVNSLSSFWDTTATSEIKGSMRELKMAIHKLGNVAGQMESLVSDERQKFSKIMSNIESISSNLKKSNDQVTAIIGNTKKISDDLLTSDFKAVISNASITIKSLNEMLDKTKKGEGSLGKLINDDKLYNALLSTSDELQNLVDDLQLHPERYIHFSLLGAKTKGLPLTGNEEKSLRKLLDSIPH